MIDELLSRCRFPPAGTRVTCAVSGGPDSVALLALAVHAGCVATAIHVDHGLRPESGEEAALVARVAGKLRASFLCGRAEVEPGPNLEARARVARYGVLPPDVLLGHTADDQAETVLLNLLRGAGIEGLAGIRDDGRRPLLRLRRAETRNLCQDLGLPFADDPSNRDPQFRRNRVRLELIPLLDDIADRDVVPVIARQAALLREVADHLASEASELDPTDASALAGAAEVLARLAVRGWLRAAGGDEAHPPDAASVDRVLAVARNEVKATEISGGWRVARSGGRLSLEPPLEPTEDRRPGRPVQ